MKRRLTATTKSSEANSALLGQGRDPGLKVKESSSLSDPYTKVDNMEFNLDPYTKVTEVDDYVPDPYDQLTDTDYGPEPYTRVVDSDYDLELYTEDGLERCRDASCTCAQYDQQSEYEGTQPTE